MIIPLYIFKGSIFIFYLLTIRGYLKIHCLDFSGLEISPRWPHFQFQSKRCPLPPSGPLPIQGPFRVVAGRNFTPKGPPEGPSPPTYKLSEDQQLPSFRNKLNYGCTKYPEKRRDICIIICVACPMRDISRLEHGWVWQISFSKYHM